MNATPLRTLLETHVDLEALRAPGAPQVFITMTNVETGLPRVVGNADLTLEALLASACLPQLFKAVEIDDESFWDGGFTGNPTLWPLIRQKGPADILLVQLSPNAATAMPSSAAAVSQRIAEIVFHSSLVAEMQAVHAIRELTTPSVAGSETAPPSETNSFRQARFHRVGPPPDGLLGTGAAGDRSPKHLQELWEAGRSDARRFLMRDGRQLGLKETLDIKAAFVDERKTRLALPMDVPAAAPADEPFTPQAPVRTRRIASPSAASMGGS